MELCPTVFRRNDAGYIEVIDTLEYLVEEIEECIKNCPGNCITWEEA